MAGIWDKLGFLFDTDDGSLPTVRVTGLGRDGLAATYALIRLRCRTSHDSVFWHAGLDREERLDAWPDAVLLVADGQAEQFHILASGVAFDRVVIPDLGVFVWPGEITLDYRMGPEWDERRVLALFELLRRLAALSPDARVTLGPGVLPAVERRFQAAFSAFCRERLPAPAGERGRQGSGTGADGLWRQAADPDALLALLGDRACPRRLRLFSVACCRRVWHLLEEAAFREAVEAAERFAAGEATAEALGAAWRKTFCHREDDGLSDDPLANARFWAADAASQAASDLDRAAAAASGAAWAAAWESGAAADAAFERERAVQCGLLRCVFGDPFRPMPAIEPAWLAWGEGIVGRLAGSIRDTRRFGDMPVLADALEEAGCDDADSLAHLRGLGPHCRGCFMIDWLLRKR